MNFLIPDKEPELKPCPFADVVEVKRGYWKDNTNGTFTCSVCGGKASKMNYCGNCGARMDGATND